MLMLMLVLVLPWVSVTRSRPPTIEAERGNSRRAEHRMRRHAGPTLGEKLGVSAAGDSVNGRAGMRAPDVSAKRDAQPERSAAPGREQKEIAERALLQRHLVDTGNRRQQIKRPGCPGLECYR
jgi:hypothetical protein